MPHGPTNTPLIPRRPRRQRKTPRHTLKRSTRPHKPHRRHYAMHTQLTRTSRLGLMALCLLALCACSRAPVRTETVEVKVPVYVALPTDLLRPCTVDMPATWTNGSLVEYAIRLKTCLSASND